MLLYYHNPKRSVYIVNCVCPSVCLDVLNYIIESEELSLSLFVYATFFWTDIFNQNMTTFIGVRVSQSWVFCVVFCRPLVCLVLLAIVVSVLPFTSSGFPSVSSNLSCKIICINNLVICNSPWISECNLLNLP
jgi:hypothetical protein